ncbi:hypothetical protein Poli38472_012914 [Pythium oligandrum]|uniref:RING-type domain-containing protein n=1 Tax=Pythium oligandrum TaxID=41045 RepID=A0A8K1FLY0_PYTOL|nr:hypothetical protein Poli38472_012914 [Pythium oligandrum]|eukprot:TMW64292.1 hypothetical protein Poli38472_012914 [Pythium oligandrum]
MDMDVARTLRTNSQRFESILRMNDDETANGRMAAHRRLSMNQAEMGTTPSFEPKTQQSEGEEDEGDERGGNQSLYDLEVLRRRRRMLKASGREGSQQAPVEAQAQTRTGERYATSPRGQNVSYQHELPPPPPPSAGMASSTLQSMPFVATSSSLPQRYSSMAWPSPMPRRPSGLMPGIQHDLPESFDDAFSTSSLDDDAGDFSDDDDAASYGELLDNYQARNLDHSGHSGTRGFGDSYNQSAEEDDDDGADEQDDDDEYDADMHGSLSNRDINMSKAIALKNSMVRNLVRLGFQETVTRGALEAGVQEIEQYDSDCELAYVDIFISLIKMVCDAHQGAAVVSSHRRGSLDRILEGLDDSIHLPFKWPVFDMAQFEFGNARAGTCFESVCVLINLPRVSMDRTEELMEILSCHVFSMIGDPIQVVIPSVNATGRTKGHAFLEFDDPIMARACATAVDGLTWGRGPFGRIRASMFRQYQVKSPIPPTESNLSQSSSNQVSTSGPQQQRHFLATRRQSLDHSVGTDSGQPYTPELSRDDLNSSAGFSSSASFRTSSQLSVSGIDERAFRQHRILSAMRREENEGHRARDDIMRLGELRLSDDEHSGTESDLEFQDPSLGRRPLPPSTRAQRIQRLREQLSQVSTDNLEAPVFPDLPPVPSLPPVVNGEAEGPWRSFCEELIGRNREMQEQLSFARRRVAVLSHNNQKLHLLIDRMERDRDGLLFENDLLQTQLHGYEDHERQQEALMRELAALRRRMRRRDQRIERGMYESGLGGGDFTPARHPTSRAGVVVDLEGGVMSLDELEEQLTQNIVSSRRLDELKEWEQMLEGSLTRVRSIKEEIAMELQKKLAQQAEGQQLQDHKLCVICLSNEKSILCLPCRHLCLCQECSQHQELDKCPICRLGVDNMLLVYA